MNTVKVENCNTLFIGRRGENEVTEVVFDFTEWQEQFGTGVINLYVKRNGDSAAYPVVLSIDGTVATWLVTEIDTNVAGNGKAEYVYLVDGKVAKSAVFPFYVGEDIGQPASEAPDPYESWLETLTALGADTQANAQAAAQSASDAAESAESASESAVQADDSAEDAEAWAVGERGGEPVSEDDPTYENNAKFWAWKAMTDAPVTSVNGKAGDIVLNLDDIPNGETYARATPAQLAQIGTNADDIADIDAMIPNTTSESNNLVNVSSLTNRLTSYRTSAAQDAIDAGKQDKISAYGILKRDRSGNITAAVAGADYVTADALNSYRKASAQDAIDNAQNTEIGKNTAALDSMQPAATTADIGKALIVKTVADGKPTSYEYGEAGGGGGGSALTAGDGIDITNDVISNTQGIEYIVGTQTGSTASWKGNSTDETLRVGKIIAYYLPYAGSSLTNATLTLTMAGGAQTAAIPLRRAGTSAVTNQFAAGNVIILIYDGTYWRVSAYYDQNDNTVPTGYCLSPAATAAKAATCSYGYRGDTNYFPCLFRFANTATDATLAITTYAQEAAPIYVNGARTSATNTFSAGVILFLYYNGAYYCYNDGRFPILVDGTVTSVQEYAAGLLADYRTAAAQDEIDAGKQSKITASGILKGDGTGGVSSAVAGTDYATPQQINAKYTKPSSGIPSTDMTSAVQASLQKADTALQAVPDTYRTAAAQDTIDNGKQPKIIASGILKGDGAGGVSAAVAGTDYLAPSALDTYRTSAAQDVIDNAQDERLDAVEQTTTATTIGPVALATFDASAANMPLKGLTVNIEPVQAEGTPSPENPLPITGWTGCNIVLSPTLNAQDGTTYPITFPTSAGTVYGGTLDVTGKTLLVDSTCIKSTWGAGTNETQLGNFVRKRFTYDSGKRLDGSRIADCRCNVTDVIVPDGYTWQSTHVTAIDNYPYISVILPSGTDDSTPIEFFAPVTAKDNYDLSDAPDITTLLGTNSIWADCGDVTVTYGAYLETLKNYADQLGDSILSAIAPLETSYTASRAYTVGSFLFVGTKFYKVTAAIASGDTITPDTNVTQTTVAAQLMALAGN